MAERALCRHAPKVGAECLNWARSDLCGGADLGISPRGMEDVLQNILRKSP